MKKFSFKIDAADACRTLPAKSRSGSGAGKGCPGTRHRGFSGFGLTQYTYQKEKVA